MYLYWINSVKECMTDGETSVFGKNEKKRVVGFFPFVFLIEVESCRIVVANSKNCRGAVSYAEAFAITAQWQWEGDEGLIKADMLNT